MKWGNIFRIIFLKGNLGKFLLPMLFFMGVSIISCGDGFKTTESGLIYRFNAGSSIDKMYGPHHIMLLHHMLIGPNGDTIENSFGADTMEEVVCPSQAPNKILEALRMMSAGSEIEVKILSDSLKLISTSPMVNLMESNKDARFIIRCEKVLTAEEFDAYRNQKFFNRIMAENKLIDEFAEKDSKKGLEAVGWTLDSSKMIKYRIKMKNGKYEKNSPRLANEPIQKSVNSILFHCEVYNIDGTLLVNSAMEGRSYKAEKIDFDPFESALLNYDVKCLNILPFYLDTGEEGEFLVTSDMGYGNRGRIGVPAYAPLRVIIRTIKLD